MANVYAYVRFSSERQGDGDSITRQITAIESYCRANGLQVTEWIEDLGRSAFKGSHRKTGNLSRFLARVAAGEIGSGSTLIVESVDRLSREEMMTALESFTTLVNAGLTIITTMDSAVVNRANLNAEWTKLIVTLAKMAVANEESEKKSNRSLSVWEARRAAPGEKRLTAFLPGWLIDVGTPNPARVAVLERIFSEVIDGIGTARIAQRLNADGIESWGPLRKKTGKRPSWHNAQVIKLARSRSVLGEFQPMKSAEDGSKIAAGPVIENYYPAVIDAITFQRAQAALNSRSFKGSRGRQGATVANLFRGLARCGACGHAYHRRGAGEGRDYLGCSGAARKVCQNTKAVPARRFENKFLYVVDEMNFSTGRAPDADAKARLAEAEHQRDALMTRIDAIAEQLIEMKSPALRSRLAEAEGRLAQVVADVEEAKDALTRIATTPAPSQSQSALVEMREALAEPGADTVAIRSRMAMLIKEVVQSITFDDQGMATVMMKADLEPYRVTVAGKAVEATVRAYRFAAKGPDVSVELTLSDGSEMTVHIGVVIDESDLPIRRVA